MKQITVVLLLVMLWGCGNKLNKEGVTPMVDLTKKYPKKEVALQNIANIKYIPLEITDDALIDKFRRIAYITKDTIVVYNGYKKGDILFFNGEGRFLYRVNHKGAGATEYMMMSRVIIDMPNKEILVYGKTGKTTKIQVYDIKGEYKRTLHLRCKRLSNVVDFNRNYLLANEDYNDFLSKNKHQNLTPYFLISKKTGVIDTIKTVTTPKRISSSIIKMTGSAMTFSAFSNHAIVPYNSGFIFDEIARDTICFYSKDRKKTPLLIKQPHIADMGEKPIITAITGVGNEFVIMKTALKDYDFKRKEYSKSYKAMLLINRKSGEIVNCNLINTDIHGDKIKCKPHNNLIDAVDLLDQLDANKLSGKLKTIAEKLDVEDNPVLMVVVIK